MSASAEVLDDVREELAAVAASLRAYLEWQEDSGALGIPRRPKEAPRTLTTRHPEPATPTPTAHALPTPAPTTHATASPTAHANTPRSLDIIQAEAATCTRCALSTSRTNVVFSRGNPESKILFIGEAPGADEDAQGIPFVGRAGQLLDKMIGAMGLNPATDVYIANILKCRPPENRRPEPLEIETCIPYLHEQIQATEPRVIVALGNTAVAALLGTTLGITKVRGQWKLYRGRIPVMPTYHPSYLLRPSAQQLEAKKQAWEDLQSVMKEMGLPLKA